MVYHFHDYTLDPASREVRHGAHRLALEPKVFQVLLYLLEHRDRMVPKAELLEQCWPETFVSESALTRCLARLRKAVQPTPTAPPVIETRHRQGYRFVAEVIVLAPTLLPTPVETALTSAPPPLQAPAPAVLPVSLGPAPSLAPPHRASLPTGLNLQSSPGAERRQLTILFCDVMDSTTLAGQLDPEDFREVMVRYHATCTEVIQHYGGHIAQYLGDGLLVYFGWPQAHEDDARRAVHAGVALVTAIRDLGTRLVQDYGMRLAVRIGMHTGLVVVGTGEGGAPYGQLAVGATPNLAAKIQSLAAPDTVVISAVTYDLVQGYFLCESLGAHTLPGTTEPNVLYQVRGASGARGRLDVIPPPQRTPFVGREVELAVLRERAAQVRQGLGQVVLLSGDAGIGKSRLVQEVTTACAAEGFTCIACYCSPYYQHTALHPVIEWLQRCIHDDAETPVSERLARLETLVEQAQLDGYTAVPLLAALVQLDLPEARYPALQLTSQQQRQHTLDILVALVVGLASGQAVLFLVEDLHWVDPTTLEWLGFLMALGPTAPLLTLLTCRPTFTSPWSGRAHVTLLSVPRLALPQVEQMVQGLGGDVLPAAQLRHIVRQTDGVPLFIEEVTKFVLAAQRLQGQTGRHASDRTAPEIAIPATLRDSLMARLDQLGPAKGTAQLGATMGREFPAALLKAVTPLDEDVLRQDLQHLVEAELLYQRGVGATTVYQFKHALIQEAAYASLLRRTRQQYHQRIAQVLAAQFPETAVAQPELLAHHFTAAGLTEKAVPYWHKAGQRASERSAHGEAIAHLRQGLALLATLPETPERIQHKVDLSITLGTSLIATQGFAASEVGAIYTRARQLCEHLEVPHQLFPVLRGLWNYYYVRAELQTAHTLGKQLLTLVQQSQDSAMLVAAHRAVGTTLFYFGAAADAHTHFAQGVALYVSQQHRVSAFRYGEDPGMACHSLAAWTLWWLGYADQGLARKDTAVTLAQQSAYPFSLCFALTGAAMFHQLRREVRCVQECAEAAMRLAKEQGFPFWMAMGSLQRGWALAQQGQAQEGIAQITQGLTAWHATGAEVVRPYCLALLAEAQGIIGEPEAGLMALAEALTLVAKTGERWYEAELYRLKGALLLQLSSDNHPEAESCFHQAIRIAQNQQAKSWELRAAMSLAQLWQQQGKCVEARELLAPIYGWFTEGFDTADLQEAKALLES